MKKCTLFAAVLLLVFSANIFAQSSDRSPVKSSPVAGSNTEAMWDLLFNHNIQAFSTAGNAGLEFDGNSFWITKWSVGGASNVMLRMNKDGTKRDSFAVGNYVGASGIRDLAWDGKYIYGGSAAGPNIVRIDTGTKAVVKTITTTVGAGNVRAIAWDPGRNGFWVCGFGGNIVCVDTNGATIPGATITSTLTGKYGLAYDNAPGGPYLYVWDQGTGAGTPQIIYQISLVTLANTGVTFNVSTVISDASGIAGGLCVSSQIIPGKVVIAGCWQGVPDRVVGLELRTTAPPASGDSVLVMFHDTTVTTGQVKRLADRDSTMKYLSTMISKYKTFYFNAATPNLPSLTNYKTVILVETSFDNSGALFLGPTARTDLKNWLSSGTASDKKTLISIGADQAYNYDRTGTAAAALDTAFSRGFCAMIYRVDQGTPAATGGDITGLFPQDLTTRTMLAPTGTGNTGYWPDGASLAPGAGTRAAAYKYNGHTATDTLGGMSVNTTGYFTVTSLQDPRYFNGGTKGWLLALITYAKANGGTITSATPLTSLVAEKYSLSQNYPNPFNPTTKINFSIPTTGFVSMKVFDVAGKEVMTLVNKNMTVGSYAVEFNGALLSSGVYFYRLESGNFVETKKMMLVK